MNCIFGLFDVLGFTSFCENCNFESAEKVLKIMDDFETEIPEIVLDGLDANNDVSKDQKRLLKSRLQWLTFSDSIFVAMPVELSAHPDSTKFNLLFFTSLCAYINRRMFEIGLPVRGTIHVGDVLVSKRCFAGKAVIDAHKLAAKCQAAVTVVSDDANTLLFKFFQNSPGFESLYEGTVIEFDVPIGTKLLSGALSENTFQRMKTLCWFFIVLGRMTRFEIPTDLERFVERQFTAHGKKLSGTKEKLKAYNTAKLFQDWKATSNRQTIHQLSLTYKSPSK